MLNFYGKPFTSRLLVGSALYPSPAIMQAAIRASGAEIVTVSLRREAAGGKTGDAFWSLIRELDVTVLPNTAGCRSVREAVTTAKLARELFATSWIKLEVIADNDTLQPDLVGLVEAASILIKDGFEVFPYCTEDLSVAMRLVDAGCKVSLSAITSSLIQLVANNSRASFAVVTASRTLRQPAVFGSTVTPSSRISDQNASPVLPPADSRRNETVTISAPEARIALCMIAGDG